MSHRPVDSVVVYVGGEGVTPSTVPPHAALELALAYFDLMQRVAEDRERNLDLRGLEILDGSVGIASRAPDPRLAASAANEVDELLAGSAEPASMKTERAYSRLSRALEGLPEGHWARASIGAENPRPLIAVRPPVELGEVWTVTTLRATPFKVGGKRPKVWFTSDSEPKPFGVTTDAQAACEVARHLYKEVEVTFRFVRGEDGSVDEGVLDSFRPLEVAPEDELGSWREWFREAGAHWQDVDDVDAALSRGNDGDEGD